MQKVCEPQYLSRDYLAALLGKLFVTQQEDNTCLKYKDLTQHEVQ